MCIEHSLPISTLVPHWRSTACVILDSLNAAAQGVDAASRGRRPAVPVARDAAALRAYPRLGRHCLDRFRFHDVVRSTMRSQSMGGFAPDEGQAHGVIRRARRPATWAA